MMKKLFAILMIACLTVSLLCLPAFAAEPASDVVLRVSGTKQDGTPVEIEDGDFKNFAEGWEAAVDYACKEDFLEEKRIHRIVVDFYADWNANADGVFGKNSWTGFANSTIFVPSDVKMTINLNGHTINRGLKTWTYDGEVICINDDADVIINGGKSGDPIIKPDEAPGTVKLGTITGGRSCNGAGGIHMQDGSKLTLNNVNITGNTAEDDDGGGIAVHDGASLVMNGGSVSHNIAYGNSFIVYGGGIYINDASATFKDVTFENNLGYERSAQGVVVYVDDGTLSMTGCKVIGNGLVGTSEGDLRRAPSSIIRAANGSKVTLSETKFLKNGSANEVSVDYNTQNFTSVINSKAGYLTMEKCVFSDNNQVYLIASEATVLNASESDFSGNKSFAFFGNCAGGFNSAFTNCTFSYNEPMFDLNDTFYFNLSDAGLSFIDCEFGGATFNNKNAAKFVDTDAMNGVGAILGEGSLPMILALLALAASCFSMGMTVSYNKKKAAPAKGNDSENDEE